MFARVTTRTDRILEGINKYISKTLQKPLHQKDKKKKKKEDTRHGSKQTIGAINHPSSIGLVNKKSRGCVKR